MESLQERDITPDDYDLLMRLEAAMDSGKDQGAEQTVSFGNHMTLALQDANDKNRKVTDKDKCAKCSITNASGELGDLVPMVNCDHWIHFKCAETLFDNFDNKCPKTGCCKILLNGFESAINPKAFNLAQKKKQN